MTTPDTAPKENPLVSYVQAIQAKLRKELARVEAYHWSPPPEPEQPDRKRHRLKWRTPQLKKRPEKYHTIDEARREMLATMQEYESGPSTGEYLLVNPAPGLGKTYACITTAQEAVGRVLYVMPTHSHYDTLQNFPHFDGDLWYHWLSTSAPIPGQSDETMCRESKYTEKLMRKGWGLRVACDGLCPLWEAHCDYRQQGKVKQKIIAGVHEHITTGLGVKNLELVIVDEEPIRAFLKTRTINADDIATSRYAGPITELYTKIKQLCKSGGEWRGQMLLDQIGDILGDVYAVVEQFDQLIPANPNLTDRSQIDELPAWFLDDLLMLLANEYAAWRHDRENWLERVIIRKGKLHLYRRAETWSDLPQKMIIVDATADIEIYEQMFPEKKFRIYTPPVEQKGSVYQVTASYLGISQMKDADTAVEMVQLCQAFSQAKGYENPGVVTFLAAVPMFQAIFGVDNVAHFGGQRGSNQLENCDAGFVVGSFSPPDTAITEMVKILNPERMEGFAATETVGGGIVPVRSERLVGYQYQREDGLQPYRMVSGLWADPELNAAMRSRREAEMIQAVHRFRPLTRDVPVWLFSSIPTGLPLAGVYDDPPIGPDGIYWRSWIKIKEWLKKQDEVTYETLAEAAGVTTRHAQNSKWLDAIVSYDPLSWETSRITRPDARGWARGVIRKDTCRS